ncbi:hypothetical protein ['Camptotheca acuminata' phytoplasma]|uniref:hypothetical protein n=1 Tax='Camptotheca acuminata' phytoplasma TaxID=3239192 RepID=UPI00351A3C4C
MFPNNSGYLTEKEITAYHESGHTLIALAHPEHFEVKYVTIKKRGHTLGHTMTIKKKANPRLDVLLSFGGQAAQSFLADNNKMDPKKIKEGCSDDIRNAKNAFQRIQPPKPKQLDFYLKETKQIIEKNQKVLKIIAQRLIEKPNETIRKEELEDIIKKNPISLN